jgi:phosphoglycolate phosphatase-like HAD superfamily hydrolase
MPLNLDRTRIVFWDFDGVIKESVQIKTAAFRKLFLPFGEDIACQVTRHHLAHGGMSRFEKLPLYLKWAGLDVDAKLVAEFCRRFAGSVEDVVVEAAWVPGVIEFLDRHHENKIFVLVTATPQREIESIVHRLSLGKYFDRIHGAPIAKAAAIRETLAGQGIEAAAALMIGDSKEDLAAADQSGVPFLYRRSPENPGSIPDYNGPSFTNFE